MNAPVWRGQILEGKYEVLEVLGEGGMGVVVAALDQTLERKVALKFLLPQYAQHEEAAARFMREARAAVKIKSEHIARVIDVNKMANGSPYMVMELLDGADLSQLLKQNGRFSVAEAVSFVLEAADAIAEAHSVGIVHRDLKPANLFLAQQPDGTHKIKVLDFGISKNLISTDTSPDAALTRTSSMMGSPLYMSPEQMRSAKDVDFRTDIWSMAVVLYELLEGRLPFTASAIPELSAKVLLEEPDAMLRTDIPAGLRDAIFRALAKSADDRYPTVNEFSITISQYAPAGLRPTVERISRLLVAAGLSTTAVGPQIDLAGPQQTQFVIAPEVVEASAMEITHFAEPQDSGARVSRTHAGWGNTLGPNGKRRRGLARWLPLAVGSSVLLGGLSYGIFSVEDSASSVELGQGGSAEPPPPGSAVSPSLLGLPESEIAQAPSLNATEPSFGEDAGAGTATGQTTAQLGDSESQELKGLDTAASVPLENGETDIRAKVPEGGSLEPPEHDGATEATSEKHPEKAATAKALSSKSARTKKKRNAAAQVHPGAKGHGTQVQSGKQRQSGTGGKVSIRDKFGGRK